MSREIKIALVDDHTLFRNGLRGLIDGKRNCRVVAEACDGANFLENEEAMAADVVFMRSQVSAITAALNLARHTQNTAKQIVIFALAIKLAVMILGIVGYASMWAAVFADSGVAALCVAYAIFPLYLKKSRKK